MYKYSFLFVSGQIIKQTSFIFTCHSVNIYMHYKNHNIVTTYLHLMTNFAILLFC